MVERRRLEDFANQDILVCGTHHQDVAEMVFLQHREAGVLRTDQTFQVTPTQAELVKYTKNTFYATKVIFANQLLTYVKPWVKIGTKSEISLRQNRLNQLVIHILILFSGFIVDLVVSVYQKDSQALGVLAEQLGVKILY